MEDTPARERIFKGSRREQKTSEVLPEGHDLESTLMKDQREPEKAALVILSQ